MPQPRLLISVRNAAEAADALAAGADLIDVKEPMRGALGMADGATICAVLAAVDGCVPTSIALGELVDEHELPELERLPAYAKFGLAGAGRLADWPAMLRSAIAGLPRGVQSVAVAYADWRVASAPAPHEVLAAAVEHGCRGLLLDTFTKSGGSLVAHLAISELRDLVCGARRQNLVTVIAGGLKKDDLANLAPLQPDYFGFRGAVCRGGREAALDPERIRTLACFLRTAGDSNPSSLARNHSLAAG